MLEVERKALSPPTGDRGPQPTPGVGLPPGAQTLRAPLRGGGAIVLRPIAPDDKEALAAGFERLSPESRYKRFLGAHARLTAAELRYLTEVDHSRHEAIVALDADTGEGVGVARYIAGGAEPQSAEIAVTVVDAWQGRGVGTALVHQLAERARAEGIERFTATVLSTNREALDVLAALGDVEVVVGSGGVSQLTIELPSHGLGSLMHVLRHAAAHRAAAHHGESDPSGSS